MNNISEQITYSPGSDDLIQLDEHLWLIICTGLTSTIPCPTDLLGPFGSSLAFDVSSNDSI